MPSFFLFTQIERNTPMLKAFNAVRKARKAFILLLVGGSLGLAVLSVYKGYTARIKSLEEVVEVQAHRIEALDRRLAVTQGIAKANQEKGQALHNTVRELEHNTQQSITSLAQIRKQDYEQNNNPTMYEPMPDSFTSVFNKAEERARASEHN